MNQNRPDNECTTRIVTLDFNGGSHVYRNPELGLNIPAQLEPGEFSDMRRAGLVSTLNREYASQGIRFTTDTAPGASAVHIGRTTDFDRYGAFLGLAEGIGSGDAFVLLDDSANDTELADVIRHEAGHILGTLDHGGTGLARYAYKYTLHDYDFASLDSGEGIYTYKKYTTNATFRAIAPSNGMEELNLTYGESYTSVHNVYEDYNTQDGHPSTEYETNDIINEGYVEASGITVGDVTIKGGRATNVTARSMSVSGLVTYDSVEYRYFKTSFFNLDEQENTYSNFHYHQGSASSCVVGSLSVGGDAVARSCTVENLRVGSRDVSFRGSEWGSGNRPLAENCTVNGGRLTVTSGGDAKNIILNDADAYIGVEDDWEREYYWEENGDAVATNLIVNGGNVTVKAGGELNNARIKGTLTVTEEGAKLTGAITCTRVFLTTNINNNITIKLDLRDYAVANSSDVFRNDKGDIVKQIDYFANYTTRTTDYTYTYVPDPDYPGTYLISSTTTKVSYGTFDNKDGRFYDIDNWTYTFDAHIGRVLDKSAYGNIILDFGGTEKDFDSGNIYVLLPEGVDDGSGVIELVQPAVGVYDTIPFQLQSDKKKWRIDEEWSAWYGNVVGSYWATETCFVYNPTLHGEAADVLWLENGWDDETEYVIDLPSEVMGSASENLTISSEDGGGLGNAVLQNSKLTVSGANGGNITISAEDSNKQDHECDLELLVVPEEIPVVGKLGAKKYSEMLKKAQKDRITKITDVLPFDIKTKLLGLNFCLTDMSVTLTVNWSQPSMELKFQGKMDWEIGKGDSKNLTLDLSGDNYISVTHKNGAFGWDFVGELSVPDFKIGKFAFSNMSLSVNKGEGSFSVGGYVQLPGISYKFGGSIGIVGGYWDSMTIGVDNLNVPLGATGLMLQSISGSIEGIATNLDMTFGGSMGLTYGPKISVEWNCDWLGIEDGEYSLLEIDLGAKISTSGEITGQAGFSSLGGFITGAGGVVASEGYFSVNGNFSLLNGCISIEGELHSSTGGVVISGKGRMQVPNDEKFGMLAGVGLSVEVQADFGSRYVLAWQNFVVFGNTYAIGCKTTFDGEVELLGSADIWKEVENTRGNLRSLKSISVKGISVAEPLRGETMPSKSEQYTVTDSGLTFFRVSFTVSTATSYASITYNGVEYTQAAISAGLYDNMQIVNELTNASCVTIAVNNADMGEWTINAYGDEKASFGAYTIAQAVEKPVVTSVTLGDDARSATINYTLGDLSALENATISIFRNDGGKANYGGLRIAEFAVADATGSFQYVMTDDMPGGKYSFYVMVTSDNLAPSYSDLSTGYDFISIDTEVPDQIQKISVQWKSTGSELTWSAPYDNTGIAGYRIRYAVGDEDMAETDVKTNTFTFDKVPNGMYDFQVAACDAAGNLSAWSEQQSCMVLTVGNAAYKDATLNADLDLSEYESAFNITAGDFAVKAAANSLIAGSVLTDAEIRGIVEDTAVNGNVELIAGAQGHNLTVNGELLVGVSSGVVKSEDPFAENPFAEEPVEADSTAAAVVEGITVASGGKLIVGNYGKASNISVAAGGTAVLQGNAEFSGLTVDYGAILTVAGNSKYVLTDDIRIAGTLNAGCTIAGNGHKIRFEQYKQAAEYYEYESVWDVGLLRDDVALTNDLDKFTGKTLEIEIDSNVYGFFKIAEKAKYFNGTVTVLDHTDGSSAAVGFDNCSLVGNALCSLITFSDGLYLKTIRSEIDPPTLTVEQAESNAYDTILLNATPAENAGTVKTYSYRYSLNADMSDAVTVETAYIGGVSISKYDLVENATYYVQASVENENGVQSLWSDAKSFTVVPKVLPDAPTSLTVTGATDPNTLNITFTASGVDNSNYTVNAYRFRYADNPEMENAITVTTNNWNINYAYIDKSDIVDGKDYYVQAGVKQSNDWSYWSDTVVFNTQGWDYDGITVGTGGDYEDLWLNGKRARNLTVTEDGFVYGDGAVEVNGISVNGGFFRASGPVSNVVVNSGEITLDENSSVTDLVANGGSVRPMYGTLNGATIGANALLSLTSIYTPTITGTILIQGRMEVYNYHPGLSTDASFVFDIGAHESETLKDKMFIDFTSPLLGTRTFTVKLDDTPEAGDYKLTYVPNSGEFYTRLAAADGTDLGLMSLGGEAIQRNGLYYALAELDSAVYLHVSENNGPLLIGKVKLSKDGTVRDSSNVYSYLTVSAASECDHVLVEDGGRLQTVTVGDGGSVDVFGEVWGATIENGGKLTMNSGCLLADNPVSIRKGGEIVVNGGMINSGAKFTVGGKLTLNDALQSYENDGDSWYPTYHEFTFALDQYTAPNDAVLISDYELVKTCNASFSVSVSANQADGVYKLMGNAASYNYNITVYYEGGPSYGSYLYIGGNGSEINGKRYLLAVKDDILTLTIGNGSSGGDPEPPKPDEPDGNDNPLNDDGSLNPDAVLPINPLSADSSTDIIMDAAGSDSGEYSNSLGGDDKVDSAQISLEKAAKLSFTVKADSKVKLTFYELVEKTDGTYKKKSLKTVTVSSKNGGEKTTASVLVEGGTGKLYYVAVENKNSQSKGAYYNVSLTTEGKNACEFFADGDNGWNNGPLLVKDGKNKVVNAVQIAKFQTVNIAESGTQNIQFDTNEILADGTGRWENFVGFGDSDDYVKLSATQPLKLNFTVTSTDNVKLTVYKLTLNKGKWSSSAVKTLTVSLKSAEKNNPGYATRKVNGILLDRIAEGLDDGAGYYVSVESTNAKKGGKAWYNVSVDSVVYKDADEGVVNKTGNGWLLHSKTKQLNTNLGEGTTITATSKVSATEIVMDGGTSDPEWGNFVGFGDVYDYAEIVINEAGTYQFTIDTKAGNSKFVVYKLTQKADKTTWTSKTLASVTIKGATDDDGVKLKKAIKIKEADVTSSNIRYFVSMQTTDQKKSPEVYYNVSAWRMDDSPASALTMPEMDSLADSFSMTDSLSLGRYDADVLTGASVADLTDLDDKSAWQNLTLA